MGLLDLAAAMFKNVTGTAATESTNRSNERSVAATNQANKDIAAANNQMQIDMNRENNAFNRDMAIEMFNMENAYNNPSNQKQLLLEAGLNPATMYGSGSQQFTSDASTPQAATSGVTPSMPALTPFQAQAPQGFLNDIIGLTGAIKNIADSSLSKAKKDEINTLLSEHWRLLHNEANGQEIMNNWNEFKFNLDNLNLPKKQAEEIRKLQSEVFKNYADGGASHALVALREMQTRLEGQEFEKLVEQRPVLLQILNKQRDLYQAQIKTEETQQKLNTANAGKATAETEAQKILNGILPEKYALEITTAEAEQITKIMNAGAAKNNHELLNQLINQGIHRTLAEELVKRRQEIIKRISQ